jgi:hypothetical protein
VVGCGVLLGPTGMWQGIPAVLLGGAQVALVLPLSGRHSHGCGCVMTMHATGGGGAPGRLAMV